MKLVIMNLLTNSCYTLLGVAFLGLAVSNCSPPVSKVAIESLSASTDVAKPTAEDLPSPRGAVIWSAEFKAANWMQSWGVRKRGDWGLQNTEVIAEPRGSRFSKVLRVLYPAGSASPRVSSSNEAPVGGAQFYADLGLPPQDALRLSYYVRFSNDFDFVKGGKLPGLFGGSVNNGKKIPDGTNGFSTRYMWRKNGDGEVYAYLPTSREHGTSIGRGDWLFQPGTWHHLEQEIVLNQPGRKNGQIQIWLDGKKVLTKGELTFRTTNALKIEGIFFSTFFGGGDSSWATPKDVYVDFADFSVSSVN